MVSRDRKGALVRGLAASVLAVACAGGALAVSDDDALFGRYKIGLDLAEYRCAPWTLYLHDREQGPLDRGELAVFEARGLEPHFPDGLTFVKVVAGVPGDRVEVADDEVFVNGRHWGRLMRFENLDRPPGYFDRSFTVGDDEYFLLGITRNSYDGRYWGTVGADQIKGQAHAIF